MSLFENNKPPTFLVEGFTCRANRKNVEPNTIRIKEILIFKIELKKTLNLKKVEGSTQ